MLGVIDTASAITAVTEGFTAHSQIITTVGVLLVGLAVLGSLYVMAANWGKKH